MSRVSSTVLMCRISSPPFRAQAAATGRAVTMFAVTDPFGAGQGSSLAVTVTNMIANFLAIRRPRTRTAYRRRPGTSRLSDKMRQ